MCAGAQTVSCQLGDYRFSEWVRRGVVPLRQALTLERLHSCVHVFLTFLLANYPSLYFAISVCQLNCQRSSGNQKHLRV